MGRAGAPRSTQLHPVKGIGWLGRVGIALLVAIVVAEWLSTRGILYDLLRLATASTPRTMNAAMWIAIVGLFARMSQNYISIGYVGLLYILPAFWLARRQQQRVRWLLVPLWCLADTFVVHSLWTYDFVYSSLPNHNPYFAERVPSLLAAFLAGAVLYIATRSKVVGLSVPLLIVALNAYEHLVPVHGVPIDRWIIRSITTRGIETTNGVPAWVIPWTWFLLHGVTAALLFRWAMRDRKKAVLSRACPHCEYSMDGLTSDRCPECGEVTTTVNAPTTR